MTTNTQPGAIWRNAERQYRRKLTRKISNKKFDANSLDFFLLCNVAGPVACATYDAINTTLTDLIKAGLLTCQRDSEEIEAVISEVWTQMATADYMPPTVQRWGEREQ